MDQKSTGIYPKHWLNPGEQISLLVLLCLMPRAPSVDLVSSSVPNYLRHKPLRAAYKPHEEDGRDAALVPFTLSKAAQRML